MSDLLRFDWRKDKKGYEVVTLTRDMFEVEMLEFGWIDKDGSEKTGAEPTVDPRAGQPKFLSRILSGGGRSRVERWLGVNPELGWDFWVESGSIEKRPPYEVSWIVGKSGQLEPYALPSNAFGIFREFADLGQDNEELIGFASKYGLLAGPNSDPVDFCRGQQRDVLEALREWQEGMKNSDLRAASSTINRHLTSGTYNSGNWTHVDTPQIELDALSHLFRPALSIRVSNLYQAIWLQFAQTVSNDTSLRHCEWCPTWFAYGPGTGKRKKGRYCSDACRKAAWNAKKLEDESGRERGPK